MSTVKRWAVATMLGAACVVSVVRNEAQTVPSVSPELLADLDVVQRAVVAGLSVGMVTRLPAELGPALAAAESNPELFLNGRSAFGLWARRMRVRAQNSRRVPPESKAEASARLEQFAAVHHDEFEIRPRSHGAPVITSVRANRCRTALGQVLTTTVVGTKPLELASHAVADATGADVPRGFVGTCIPENPPLEQPLRLSARQTLESALAVVVGQFPGTAWVAVQSPDGGCSLGIIERSSSQEVCFAAITANMNMVRSR